MSAARPSRTGPNSFRRDSSAAGQRMKKKASEDFKRFHTSCFDNSWGATRDGLDEQSTLALSKNERKEAETLLLDALQHTSDSRPFIAAGLMRKSAASPILKHRLSSGFGSRYDYLRVHAARALYQIEKWREAAATIIDVLTNTPRDNQWARMMAVEALADFQEDAKCHAVLFATVEDDDDFIGFLAIESLKKVFSRDENVCKLLEILRETQIKPNRWNRQHLQQRCIALQKLQSATGIQMPAVAMERKGSA